MAGPVGLLPYSYIRLIAQDPPMQSALRFYGGNPVEQVMRQIIRGRTSLADQLRSMVPADVQDRVIWPGFVPHDRIAELMGERTIFVQPSICEEGFGLPLAEAMACGLPCVGTRRGGITELLEHSQAGLLVEPGNSEALALAIDRLLLNHRPSLAMGDAAALRIASMATWDIVSGRLWLVWKLFDRQMPGQPSGTYSLAQRDASAAPQVQSPVLGQADKKRATPLIDPV
jgi:glycosyltransferase involved in cell wall biosynthesis